MNEKLISLVANGDASLWRFAEKASGGRWTAYNHLKILSRILQRNVLNGRNTLLFGPPRHGKSYNAARWMPTWLLHNWPEKKVIITSHSDRLPVKFSRYVRNYLENEGHLVKDLPDKNRGPRMIESKAVSNWETPEGGGILAAGVGGGIVGTGGDVLIATDLYKDGDHARSDVYNETLDAWWSEVFWPRREDSNAVVILDMVHWVLGDKGTRLMEEQAGDWDVIEMKAIAEEGDIFGRKPGEALWPEKFPISELMRIKSLIGVEAFEAQYQCNPSSSAASIFRNARWQFYDDLSFLKKVESKIQSWDMTFKKTESGSYVVGQDWGWRGADFILFPGWYRERVEYSESRDAVKNRWEIDRKRVDALLVERGANGDAIESDLKNICPVLLLRDPEGSKEARARAVSPIAEAGHVWLPSPRLEPRVNDFLLRLNRFPNCKDKDEIDTMTQALLYMRENMGNISFMRAMGG